MLSFGKLYISLLECSRLIKNCTEILFCFRFINFHILSNRIGSLGAMYNWLDLWRFHNIAMQIFSHMYASIMLIIWRQKKIIKLSGINAKLKLFWKACLLRSEFALFLQLVAWWKCNHGYTFTEPEGCMVAGWCDKAESKAMWILTAELMRGFLPLVDFLL